MCIKLLLRDLDEPVGFSVCEEENGDLFVYVGEVYGCQVLENASLNNYGSADDPTSSISTDEESQVSSESSEVTDTISTLESSEYITSAVTSNESTTSATLKSKPKPKLHPILLSQFQVNHLKTNPLLFRTSLQQVQLPHH